MYEFENDVNMYGTQTIRKKPQQEKWFENDVNMYGTQTFSAQIRLSYQFENDVNMYGTQTKTSSMKERSRFENDVKYLKQWNLQNSCTANNQKVLSELRMM